MSRASSRVFIEPALQGIRAYGIRFDANNKIIAETPSTLFIDYTRSEVRSIIRATLKDLEANA